MRLAMEQAEESIAVQGNPFGAVLVNSEGVVVAAGRNTVTSGTDILHHAELNVLREATKKTGKQKFPDCALFVNAASCAMCASALVQAGVRNFFYGAPFEPHTNPALTYESLSEYCNEPLLIHGGLLAEACRLQIERGRTVSKT